MESRIVTGPLVRRAFERIGVRRQPLRLSASSGFKSHFPLHLRPRFVGPLLFLLDSASTPPPRFSRWTRRGQPDGDPRVVALVARASWAVKACSRGNIVVEGELIPVVVRAVTGGGADWE